MPSLIIRLEPLPGSDRDSNGSTPPPVPLRPVADVAEHENGNATTPLARWSAAAAAAHDACLILDTDGAIVSISAAAAELLGCSNNAVIGRRLLDVIDVVDLETSAPHPDYASLITPLAVLTGRGLMRSLLRVRHSSGSLITVDTASAPVHDAAGDTVGSVSFLAAIASL